MKKLLIVASLLCLAPFVNAQLSYSLSAANVAYTANTAPTTIHAAGVDVAVSASIPIGFSFTYGCNTFTNFYCGSDGWIILGGSPFSEGFNSLSTSTQGNKIAALWDDLQVGASGTINYKLTGASPNRVLTVEFNQMEWDWLAAGPVISFQIQLVETTNQIRFNYKTETNAVDPGSASVGLQGATVGDFLSLQDLSAAPSVSSVTEASGIVVKPANNQRYTFTPAAACSGAPLGGTTVASSATANCSSSPISLSLTGSTLGCGITFQWQSSTDNVTWTPISGATSSTYAASVNGTTYYRCVTTCSNSGLSAISTPVLITFTGTVPLNDMPCNAVLMTVGLTEVGNNTCAMNSGEPATPSCWTTGTINSVWYRFVATTANMTITTLNSTITGTQLSIYSGTCGSLTALASGCAVDGTSCGFTTITNASINLTGLTVGSTYFIMVDGDNNAQGSFTIIVNPTGTPPPPVQGQDCVQTNPICNQNMTIADPGFQGIGATCDLPSSYCLASAERGSAWYSFTTSAAGVITFDIIPNNWPGGASSSAADYDFAIWKMGGTVTCASILAGTSTPLRCNYSGLGVTGLNGTAAGTAPAAWTQFNSAYEAQLSVLAGETYYLLINNHSTSVDGFALNFSGSSPIIYTAPTSVSWMGGDGISTQWDLNNNWGACNYPTCAINATINPFTNQPTITGTKAVRNITINPGATLTLAAGSVLQVCGDFVNLGSIVASPTSTVVMMGTGNNQTMSGSFSGANAFGNLTITKSSAAFSVLTNDDIDVKGSFTTTNSTSVFNSNNKYIKVGVDFLNASGNATFLNTGTTGTLEFFGTGAQNYNQGSSQLDLNNVVMNHTGTNVVLATNMFIKSVTGTLTLTLGKIQTNTNRVDVANNANTSVSVGNNSSYVYGNLYRALNGAIGAYDFPLGTASLYERATINFTTATTIPVLQTRFDSWGAPALHTNGNSECATTYNIADENMGYWTINASANPTSGTYNSTLYCNGATNTAGVAAWTVEKSQDLGVTWLLNGTCDPSSTSTIVKRNGMNGFSLFAAAQATNPLPVELLGFYGFSTGRENTLQWTTQSEDNSAYFSVERSKNGMDFYPFNQVEAKGHSVVKTDYQLVDHTPYYPVTYYRLRQVDLDENYSYTLKIAVESDLAGDLTIYQIYPNPTTKNCAIEVSVQTEQTLDITVVDATGNVMFVRETILNGGGEFEIPSNEWSNGIYFVRITTNLGQIATTKFVKE